MCSAGHAMNAERAPGAVPNAERSGGTLLGKRYADELRGFEVLCTKGGTGALSLGGKVLTLRAATPLPSSD